MLACTLLLAPVAAQRSAGAEPSAQEEETGGRRAGRFILQAHDGRSVTDQDFRGRHLLVFFGYMHCPDICPTHLQTLARAMDLLGPLAHQVQPLFITLDPARDNAEGLAEYVASFHPRILGLTGRADMIERVARDYRVQYAIRGGTAGAYTIDHTASFFHVDPDGYLRGQIGGSLAPEEIVARLRPVLEARRR